MHGRSGFGWVVVSAGAALAAGTLAALAGCATHTTTRLGPGGNVRAPRACTKAALRIRLDRRAAGVAAGTAFLPLDFTNVSAARCGLAGFPVVMVATGPAGRRVGAPAGLDNGLTATSVVLAAGRTAHIWLRLANVLNLPKARCRPVSSAGLLVGLPGQPGAAYLKYRVTTCSRPVPGLHVLTVEPFRAGPALRGTAQ